MSDCKLQNDYRPPWANGGGGGVYTKARNFGIYQPLPPATTKLIIIGMLRNWVANFMLWSVMIIIFSSAWLCQKSSWNRNLSVVRPSVRVAIISELNARISFKFWMWLPLGDTLGLFLNFWKKEVFFNFLQIFFVFVNVGPYRSENFKTLLLLQITAESFQIFFEFSS